MPHACRLCLGRLFTPLVVVSALLAGCGGGGGSDSDGAAGSSAGTVTAAECSLPNFQRDLLTLVNQRRAAGATCGDRGPFPAAPALSWSAVLTTAAAGHSRDRAVNDFFSHTGSDNSTSSQRVTSAGYSWRAVGENIAAGYPTVQAVVDGWMKSDGHCANIMNASYTQLGVACVPSGGSARYSNYWTMDLAAPR